MSKDITEKRAVDKNCQYSVVMAVVKRAKELRRVTKEKNIPLDDISVVNTTYIKPLTVAFEEFKFGKIDLKLRASYKEPDQIQDQKPVLDVVGEKKVAEEKVAEEKVAEKKVAEETVAEEKVAEKKVAGETVAEEKPTIDEKPAEEKVAESADEKEVPVATEAG